MNKPAILSNPEAFVVVPVEPVAYASPQLSHFLARRRVPPFTVPLFARPEPTALADIVTYCAALEAEREHAFEAGMSYGQSVMPKGTFVTIDSDEMVLLRRRNAELESERDAAYRKGAEDMRERAAAVAEEDTRHATAKRYGHKPVWLAYAEQRATAIRKLEPTP